MKQACMCPGEATLSEHYSSYSGAYVYGCTALAGLRRGVGLGCCLRHPASLWHTVTASSSSLRAKEEPATVKRPLTFRRAPLASSKKLTMHKKGRAGGPGFNRNAYGPDCPSPAGICSV